MITLQGRVGKCSDRLHEISTTLLVAEEDLSYAEAGLAEDRDEIQKGIDVFDWLIRHYNGEDQTGEDDGTGDGSGNR